MTVLLQAAEISRKNRFLIAKLLRRQRFVSKIKKFFKYFDTLYDKQNKDHKPNFSFISVLKKA